jgi:TP901 family phage tail tape measure protein
MELFRLFGSVLIDDKEAMKSLNKLERETKKNKKAFDDVGTAVLAATAAIGAMAIAIGGKALKSAVEFEKQMANVGTLLDGDVKGKMKNLGETVKDISKDMGISTATLTDGLYNVISALGESEDSMKILEVAAKGAAAGGATVTDSVNLISAVTKGYGDTSVKAAEKASDLAFLAVKLGQTTFPELASSMGKVIPLASTLKVSQEELFGAMATLTGVTGGTSEVTTQLRGVLTGVVKPTKEMTDVMKNAGYESASAALEAKGLSGFLDILKDATGGSSDQMAKMFGSAEALTAVLALTGSQSDNFREKTEAMNGAVGATNDAFAIQQDTVGVTFDKLKAKADVFLIDLGEKLLPTLVEVLDWFMEKMPEIELFVTNAMNGIAGAIAWVVDNANWLIPILTTLFTTFVALKIIGAVTYALGLLKAIMVAASAAGGIFNLILAANPAFLIALAIGVLIGVIMLLWMNWDKVSKWMSTSFKWLGNMFIGLVNIVIGGINAMIKGFLSPINLIIKGFNATLGKLTGKIPEIKLSIPEIPKLAMGGLVYGDSLVNVGEYAGARSNPEVIAPLDKLKDYMNNEIDYKRLAYELKNAISGMSVVLDDRKVGEFVDYRIVKGVL